MAQGIIRSNPNLQDCCSYFSSAVVGGPATTSMPEVSLLITADNPTTGNITYNITDLTRFLAKKVFIIKTIATGPGFKTQITIPAGSIFSSSGTNTLQLDDADGVYLLVFGISAPMVVGAFPAPGGGGGGGVNIYNSDGVITDPLRTANLGGNQLFFDNTGTGMFTVGNAAAVGTMTPPNAVLHIDNDSYAGTGKPGSIIGYVYAAGDFYFLQNSEVLGLGNPSVMMGHANNNAPTRSDLIAITDRQIHAECADTATGETATLALTTTPSGEFGLDATSVGTISVTNGILTIESTGAAGQIIIDPGALTNDLQILNLANAAATDVLWYDPVTFKVSHNTAMLGTVTNFSFTNANGITGVVTNPTTTPDLTLSLDNDSVTYAKIQEASAGNVVLANPTAGAANYQEVALAASNLLGRGTVGNIAPITLGSGLSMAADVLSSTGSGGTVTNVSVTTANGVSAVVTNPTTTPDLTFTLGAITPSSVASTGTVTGTNLSGTNTGDQTITLTTDVTGSGTGSFATTIANNAVTYAKFQEASVGNVILANATAGATEYAELAIGASQLAGRGPAGNIAAISLGTGLSITGTTLNATGVGSGDGFSVFLTGNIVTAGPATTTFTLPSTTTFTTSNGSAVYGYNTGILNTATGVITPVTTGNYVFTCRYDYTGAGTDSCAFALRDITNAVDITIANYLRGEKQQILTGTAILTAGNTYSLRVTNGIVGANSTITGAASSNFSCKQI